MAQNYEDSTNIPICKYYARGYCARGASCYYSHSQSVCRLTIEPVTTSSYAYEKNCEIEQPSGAQCLDYMEGYCPKGPACPLKHISLPLSKVSSSPFIYT